MTEVRCLLCDQPMPSAEAETSTGSKSGEVCPVCAALSPEERHTLRDNAMTRMLRRPPEG